MEVPLIRLMGACAVLFITSRMASAFQYGLPASVANFPFVVSLFDKEWTNPDEDALVGVVPFCTGTILAAKFVLTSRTCLKDDPGTRLYRRDQISAADCRMVAGSAYGPLNIYHTIKYPYQDGINFFFPSKEDHMNVFGFKAEQELTKAKGSNYEEYEVLEKGGGLHKRYYLDFGLIETAKRWTWSRYTLPAIVPTGTRSAVEAWWQSEVNRTKQGRGHINPCYAIGWGGFTSSKVQIRLRYNEVKFVKFEGCDLAYCAECSYCNKTLNIDERREVCFKSLLHGDACNGDGGAPLFCPWWTTWRNTDKGNLISVRGGAVLGILSYWKSCYGKNLPSVYQYVWNAYDLISRGLNYGYPPDVWVYEDWLKVPEDEIDPI